jgi:hypothetical protein
VEEDEKFVVAARRRKIKRWVRGERWSPIDLLPVTANVPCHSLNKEDPPEQPRKLGKNTAVLRLRLPS